MDRRRDRRKRGAAEGEGLGNAFLSHIAAVDGILHVCRGFDDVDVIHVEGRVVRGDVVVGSLYSSAAPLPFSEITGWPQRSSVF